MKHFMHVHLKYGIFSHHHRRNAASANIALPTNLPLLAMFNALILDSLDISSCHQQRLFLPPLDMTQCVCAHNTKAQLIGPHKFKLVTLTGN